MARSLAGVEEWPAIWAVQRFAWQVARGVGDGTELGDGDVDDRCRRGRRGLRFCRGSGVVRGVRAFSPSSSLAIALVFGGCNVEFSLPPEVAESKYIAYHTDADPSAICMADLLAREDRFIEGTAALLGVEPPTESIHFVWDLEQTGKEPWACRGNVNCYKDLAEEELSVVVSQSPTNHHEIVHAIDAQALGTKVHPTLAEGLAEYLGSLQTSAFESGAFPGAFKSMLARSSVPDDYALAMHFVGSILALHGAEKFKELRARVPASAGVEEFAAAFESVYGQALDSALAQMSAERVFAVDPFPGCDEGPELSWADEGLLDTTLAGACGDPWFFGAGIVEGRMGFFGYYVVEVPRAGQYELTVGAATGAPAPLRGVLAGCSFELVGSQLVSLNGKTSSAPLQAGRHTLLVAFPPQSVARGEAAVRLAYVGPLPSP